VRLGWYMRGIGRVDLLDVSRDVPANQIRGLLHRGAAELSAVWGDRSNQHIENLEAVLERVRRMDSWTVRLAASYTPLTPKSRRAFEGLVRLGCTPDALAYYIEVYRNEVLNELDLRRLAIHRLKMRGLSLRFRNLTNFWQNGEFAFDASSAFAGFDRTVVDALWREADRIDEYLALSHPQKRGPDRKNAALLLLTMDVSAMTGKFNDQLVAALVSSVSPMRAEALKRGRARTATALHYPGVVFRNGMSQPNPAPKTAAIAAIARSLVDLKDLGAFGPPSRPVTPSGTVRHDAASKRLGVSKRAKRR
jgi:hypothetical protein